jgi:NADH-quinone oxidoreductase subunit B
MTWGRSRRFTAVAAVRVPGRQVLAEYAGRMAAVDLPLSRPGSEPGLQAGPGPVVLDTGRGYSLWVFDAGLACCAVECAAALSRVSADAPAPAPGHPGIRANVLIVAGTVTDKLAPLVLAAYQRVPEPKFVLSFGACSNSGGPYWDSYCVTKGVDQMIPVDVYVPGCPPRPEALLDGLDVLVQRGLGES